MKCLIGAAVERHVSGERDRQLVSVPGQGSGVVIDADGSVLTAAHVVQTAEAIHVEFPGGRRVRARVVASEPGLLVQRVVANSPAAALRMTIIREGRRRDLEMVVP